MASRSLIVLQPDRNRRWWEFWRAKFIPVPFEYDPASCRLIATRRGIAYAYRLCGFDEAEARGEIVFAGRGTEPFICSRELWEGLPQA